jgi:hypothetical protein
MKHVYVVLGMSRSGTSAIARSLKVLGIDLGDKLLAGDKRNPKGFYEDSDILYKINRGISRALDMAWADVNTFDQKEVNHNKTLFDYKNYAVKLVRERLAKTQHWGFKDPRTITILPFWKAVFSELDVDDRYIITVRNPLATAYSNQKFVNSTIEMGLILWLVYMVTAINETQGKKRVIVSYELMLDDAQKQLERIHAAIGEELKIDPYEANQYVKEFLDKKLSHHRMTEEDLAKHSALAIVPLCSQVYAILMRLAKGEIGFESSEFHYAWRAINEEFSKVYPVYGLVNTLLKQNKNQERKIRAIHKSIAWKFSYPVRAIETFFRSLCTKK